MHCEDLQKQLKAFFFGQVPVDVRQRMQAHLAECAACQAAQRRIDALAGMLAGMQTPPVPHGLAGRVVLAAGNWRQAEPTVAWNPFYWWQLTSAPMHLAAAAVGTVSAMRGDPLDVYQLDYLDEAPEGALAVERTGPHRLEPCVGIS